MGRKETFWCDRCETEVGETATQGLVAYRWGVVTQIRDKDGHWGQAHDPKRQVDLCLACRNGADAVMRQYLGTLEKEGEHKWKKIV
jgi:hypothetical protein